jgi:hypothetical protein
MVLERPKAPRYAKQAEPATTNGRRKSPSPMWANKHVDAKEKIKPRGLAGLFEGRFRYDEQEDIFNLKR